MFWSTWLRTARSLMSAFNSKVWLSIMRNSARSTLISVIVKLSFLIRKTTAEHKAMRTMAVWINRIRNGTYSWRIFSKMALRNSRNPLACIYYMLTFNKANCRINSKRSSNSWSPKNPNPISRKSSQSIDTSIWSKKNSLKAISVGRKTRESKSTISWSSRIN